MQSCNRRRGLRSVFGIRWILVVTVVTSVATPVHATFHEWRITELYSNSSGTIQFIELGLPATGLIDNESFVSGQTLTDSALSHTYTFPHNTVSVPTLGAHLLIATPGYAALSGVPAADFLLPSNNFFSTSADTITYSSPFISQFTFPSPSLPTDGINSLTIDPFVNHNSGSAVNSPTNLLGQTGSINVPEPSTMAFLVAGAVGLLACAWRRRAMN
jgi:serralysin